MRAADLDDVVPRRGFGRDRVVQRLHGRNQTLLTLTPRQYTSRKESIVRRLRHIDVIVGVHRRLAAERRAGKLAAAIRDHFVHVHVELRAAAGHPDVQRKHILVLAGQNLVADLRDQPTDLVVEPPAGMVRQRRGLFQEA